MLYAGLDLSRKRLDFHLLDAEGATVEVGAAPPDADGLRGLSERIAVHDEPIRAALESMNGARFVHDSLELIFPCQPPSDLGNLFRVTQIKLNINICFDSAILVDPDR